MAGLEAALNVNLIGVWARDPPELVGLGAPLEPGGSLLGGIPTEFVKEFDPPLTHELLLEGAGSSI